MADPAAPADDKHKISTTITDTNHPNEKWTIETVQNDGEMLTAFLARHMMAVIALRKLIGDGK